jgi:hypothetical protein
MTLIYCGECLKEKEYLGDDLLEGDMCYVYFCSNCSKSGDEGFEFAKPKWDEIIRVAMINILQKKEKDLTDCKKNLDDKGDMKWIKNNYCRSDEIVLFIEKNWKKLCRYRYRLQVIFLFVIFDFKPIKDGNCVFQ